MDRDTVDYVFVFQDIKASPKKMQKPLSSIQTAHPLGIQAWQERRASLGIRLAMDQCVGRTHSYLVGDGACPDPRSCPLGGGSGCHDGDLALKVPCFWEMGGSTLDYANYASNSCSWWMFNMFLERRMVQLTILRRKLLLYS
ncbi:UNVERIFIED_CONTAM: hypothetical protein Sangu_2541700 [Sesamum angustifolium]|uniref:Uncharacterized protein n=1 Tax=Sesamum angustifolium TaxID=2727405 RepID=A0AAW2J9S8_9LAMI